MNVSDLQHQYKVEKDSNVRERLLMIIWLSKGKTTYEVADLLDCPQSKVMYWKSRFENEGVDGLKTRSRPGKPPKIPEDDTKRIREKLMSSGYWQTKWGHNLKIH